ncbi:MAG TPA: hypothetical protein VG936_12740 [Lacunisphaera sp.]|nr:hypothetical protein [Lacunisphaera sp.]
MDDSFPRLLFFTSEIPQSRNAGSMQLFRALQDYPGDRLRVIGPELAPGATGLPCPYRTRRLGIYRLVNTRFRAWVTGINALDLWPEPGLGRTLAAVEDFQPDLVVTVMDHLSYYKHAWKLARHLGAGLVTITMDDPQTFEVAHRWLQGAYDRVLSHIYQSTALSLGVSREMCDYLAEKFGRTSTPFYFGPPSGLRWRPAADSLQLRDPSRLTLAYAGSLGLGYRDGILALLPALEATGTDLQVYSHYRDVITHPRIVNRGFLPPEDLWAAVQRDCDAVLLPYAYAGDILNLYRTHFPTKLSEYCWTGMPMLLSGPALATGIRWGQRHPECALVATDPGVDACGPLLRRLRDDPELRRRLAAGSAAMAQTEFDPATVRRRFADLMRQARDCHHGAPAHPAAG